MKKVLISYFSQGGTTEKISKEIGGGLKSEGCKVDYHKITESGPADISSYDAIGIGFPVYVYRVPFIVTDYIKKLPDLEGKPFFVFLLCGSVPGNAGTVARKMLSGKGGREIGFAKYKGYNRFLGFLKRGYLFSYENPTKGELDHAGNFGRGLVQVINGSSYTPPPYDKRPDVVYTLERFLTVRPFLKYFYRFFYKVDRKKCSQCKLCEKVCPVNNITLSRDGFPRWGSACIGCFYCEMICPKEAITSPIDWLSMKMLISYNLRQSRKDPSIEHVPAVLKEGKIIRLE
ncbi:MAG TPA: EFR1 family ferrodoxin [Spirochaetota bacterium]|nr:EFR1 family ferrodoxin [Spirochaetota bacterium]